ncbi:bifunctional DNA primase/polymerase [Streptomyces bacillaris]|uniref:bifunctional DNA primase/polymerase n=1 Tax=Streptomyces bacillaris TaxID=68179 RepID=UPI0036E836B0
MTMEASILDTTQFRLDVPLHDTDRAAHFAALGFGVVPMPTNKKMPIHKGWPDLAMTSVEEVEIYWRTFTPYGWQNIALTLDGWTVVDVDPKNGGTASLAMLLEKYDLPLTRTHHTASGADSLHFIYRADPDRPLKSAPLNPVEYPGIDIKTGRGSLIVAPGSMIGGKRYQVVSERQAVVAPPWLSEIQQAAQHPAASSGRSRTPSRAPAGQPGGSSLAALRALPPDHPGRDNSWLCQVAGKLARKHADYPAYLRELREIDSESEVPHEEGRFMKTADSIWDREQEKPAETREPVNPEWGYPIQLKDGASNIRNLRTALNSGAIPDVYVQNGQLVKLYDDFGNVELPQGESQKAVTPLTNDGFGNEAADHIYFYKEVKDEDTGEYKKRREQPRQEVLRVVLGNRSWPGVPPLRGITRVPILRIDGTVLNKAGYDADSGMYFDPMCEFDQVPGRPTRAEVDHAFDFVHNQVLGGFPYASQADRANAFAYATHAVGRRFLEGASDGGVQPTPGANITAGSQGTGKSYLANIVRWTSGGTMTDYRPDETELSKTVISSLYNKSGAVVILDNVPDGYMVKNTTLANFLTSGTPDARLLGQTKNIRMINDVFWVLTGNGTRLSDDNRRRFFDIKLDAKMANPAMRDHFVLGDLESFFKRNRKNRAKFIWCCLVLWRAWVVAGADEATPPMRGSYGWWSRPTAGFLEFLGIEGFMDNYDPGASAEADHWVPFLSAWFEKYGTKRLKVGQLMKDHIDNGERDGWDGAFMLPTNAADFQDVRKAGDILAGKIDKVWSSGLVLRSAKRSGSNTYWVEKTEN